MFFFLSFIRVLKLLMLLIMLRVLFADPVNAQEKSDSVRTNVKLDSSKTGSIIIEPAKESENSLDTASFKVNEVKFIGYPYAFYTPETQFALGVGGMLYFRTALLPLQNPSKVTVSGYYTSNSQYYISLKPRIYLPGKKRFYLESDFYYSNDIGKFYGLGNSTSEIENSEYKTTSFGIYLETQIRGVFFKFLQNGLLFDYVNVKMEDKMGNPNLSDTSVKGINGGKVGGIGLSFSYDNRDNVSFPSSGGLYKYSMLFYGRFLASDYTYNRYKIDLRQYVSPLKEHILAFQLYSDLSTGNPPFFFMPALGGVSRMRGFYEGRYREKNFITVQAEYRKIVWWRLGFAVFYSAGDVFHNFNELRVSDVKQAYGLGLRFVFDPKEKINLRVDFGKTNAGTGVYFSMDEAF